MTSNSRGFKQSDYMTIKVFSELVKQTPQAIYLRIRSNPDFAKYTETIDGKMMIHRMALQDYGIRTDPETEAPDPEPKQDESKDELIQVLKDTIADLKRQIAVKDSQIERIMQSLLQEQSLMLIRRQEAPEAAEQARDAPERQSQADIQHSVHHDDAVADPDVHDRSTGKRQRKGILSRFWKS